MGAARAFRQIPHVKFWPAVGPRPWPVKFWPHARPDFLKRRRTRCVLRRLHNRREDNMTIDEMVAAHLLDEMLAVDNAPEMEVEDVACLGERSWAERDAECRACAVDLGDC